jgi:hypothetical protein
MTYAGSSVLRCGQDCPCETRRSHPHCPAGTAPEHGSLVKHCAGAGWVRRTATRASSSIKASRSVDRAGSGNIRTSRLLDAYNPPPFPRSVPCRERPRPQGRPQGTERDAPVVSPLVQSFVAELLVHEDHRRSGWCPPDHYLKQFWHSLAVNWICDLGLVESHQ